MVNREFWVYPLNLQCKNKGEFYSFYPDLPNFQKEFFSIYRMTLHKIWGTSEINQTLTKGNLYEYEKTNLLRTKTSHYAKVSFNNEFIKNSKENK